MLFAADARPQGSLLELALPFMAIALLFYVILLRPQRQQEKVHQSMLASLKKDDRIVTSSGIYGVVTNVHREADKVTIKVDENTNTKLHITLGSIGKVLREEPASESSESGDKPKG